MELYQGDSPHLAAVINSNANHFLQQCRNSLSAPINHKEKEKQLRGLNCIIYIIQGTMIQQDISCLLWRILLGPTMYVPKAASICKCLLQMFQSEGVSALCHTHTM